MKRTEWLQETRMLRFEEALDACTERRLTQATVNMGKKTRGRARG